MLGVGGKDKVTRAIAGMRGGLGRVLLTAFMLLAIVPLAVVSYLAIQRVRRDMGRAAVERVDIVADARATRLRAWVSEQRCALALLAASPVFEGAVRREDWDVACQALAKGDMLGYALLTADAGKVGCGAEVSFPISITVPVTDITLVGYPSPSSLAAVLDSDGDGEGERVFLLDRGGELLLSTTGHDLQREDGRNCWVTGAASGQGNGCGMYVDASGQPVVGAYRYLPDVGVTLVVEQPQEVARAREDDLAAMLIGSTLAVALLTTVLAAVITRQLTSPIVRLTMSAVRIAGGDLSQRVKVNRRDEIGILAQAFNIMTAELQSLYGELERKVEERTKQLTEANQQLRFQAMQLALSAEVGRVATSILDPDLLLSRVTELILDSYAQVYGVRYVAIFLRDGLGEWVELQAFAGEREGRSPSRVAVGDESAIGRVVADGRPRIEGGKKGEEVVLPLRIGSRVIGVLELWCALGEGPGKPDLGVLQSLGDQISVAIENARVYAAERAAVERLSKLDHVRLQSLSVGSRELATELNTIIGFSRLILKEADGPLNDMQRSDMVAIYKSGFKLMGLIDNVVTLSELESGAVQPERKPVDLAALLDGVLAAARQRLVDMPVEWRSEGPLPPVVGDAPLLRQAILSLVLSAAEQVMQGRVFLCTGTVGDDGAAVMYIGGGDMGAEEALHKATTTPEANGGLEKTGVGLALARRIVSLHGGEMWFLFDAEQGWSSVLKLPGASAER